jgi:predicted NBD/HSP70 family sugar kinase
MPTPPRGNRDLIRAINRSAVLNTIKNIGPVSRTDIAQRTGLSAATITGITAELIENGLVLEKEEGDSRGGRKPILLALNPHGGFVIGLKLAEDHITGALTDLEATVITKHTVPLNNPDLEDAVDTVVELVKSLQQEESIGEKNFLGVGVGLAGIIDANRGVLRYSPIFGWRNISLADILQERLHVPVYIDNDVNTLTISELWFGMGQGIDNFLTVTVGRGVGLGIVVNGQILLGASGGAGEFGHTVIEPDGPVCDCGKRGCLETFASDPALMRMAGEALARGKLRVEVDDVRQLLEMAEYGDQVARDIYAQAGEMLGRGVANLINLFNPELIIISGEGIRAIDWLFPSMRESVKNHVLPDLAEDTRIEIDVWDDDAWARGAAGLVLCELFASPVH